MFDCRSGREGRVSGNGRDNGVSRNSGGNRAANKIRGGVESRDGCSGDSINGRYVRVLPLLQPFHGSLDPIWPTALAYLSDGQRMCRC